MNGKQHFKVGIGAGIGTGIALMSMSPYGVEPTVGAALGGVIAAFASKLPDIDHNSTKIGRARHKVTSTSNVFITIAAVVLSVFSIFLAVTGRTNIAGHGIPTEILWKVAAGCVIVVLLKQALSQNKTVKWMTAHRGFMHTLILPICFGVGAWFLTEPLIRRALIGLTVGYVCHLDADMYTVDGCPLMFPITKHSFRRPGAKKSEDKALNRIATMASIRYIITGVAVAILLHL